MEKVKGRGNHPNSKKANSGRIFTQEWKNKIGFSNKGKNVQKKSEKK